jgi:hypothetical protein
MPLVADSYAARTAEQLDQLDAIGLVAYTGNVSHAITRQQHDALLAEGKDVAVIIEHTFDAWRQGFDKGQALGIEARAAATALGRPANSSIGIAVDDDIQPSMLGTALSHVSGFRSAVGNAWVYGTAYLIDNAVARGYATHGMQSCSTAFYDNARLSPHAALRQHCHPDVDLNDVLAADWGQESGNVVPKPIPAPTPVPQEKDTTVIALAHVKDTEVAENEQPYVDIAPDGKSIVAYFAEGAFGATALPKVTNGFGLADMHLEPGEIAERLATRSQNSILVVLADHTTRTLQVDPELFTPIS